MRLVYRIFLFIGIMGMLCIVVGKFITSKHVQHRADKIIGEDFVRSMQMSNEEEIAREARSSYLEYLNLYEGNCKGLDFMQIKKKDPKSMTVTDVACLKQIQDSRASLSQVIKKRFSNEPEVQPHFLKTIQYQPHKYGYNGLTIELPFSKNGYSIENMKGGYYIKFDKAGIQKIGWSGWSLANYDINYLRKLEKPDPNKFGIPLINQMDTTINIHLNIPKDPELYASLNGELQFEIWAK